MVTETRLSTKGNRYKHSNMQKSPMRRSAGGAQRAALRRR